MGRLRLVVRERTDQQEAFKPSRCQSIPNRRAVEMWVNVLLKLPYHYNLVHFFYLSSIIHHYLELPSILYWFSILPIPFVEISIAWKYKSRTWTDCFSSNNFVTGVIIFTVNSSFWRVSSVLCVDSRRKREKDRSNGRKLIRSDVFHVYWGPLPIRSSLAPRYSEELE